MISLSRETKDLIYKTLNALEKVPKVKDVDESLKELIKQELRYKKVKYNYDQRDCKYFVIHTNVTDKLVDSYIGVELKKIRVERRRTAFLAKRVPSVKDRKVILQYYSMSHWDTIKCDTINCKSTGYRLRNTLDLMKIDFTKKVLTFKDITVDDAAELIMKEHTEQLKLEFLKFVNSYFK